MPRAFFMRRSFSFFITSIFVGIGALSLAPHAHAAVLYFDPDGIEVHRGDTVTIALRLDTDEGECVNTVSGVIHYDPSISAIDISRGDSILNLWVEEPHIDEQAHTISFAGGLPGGYCGRIPGDPSLTNTILRVVFRSPGLQIGGGGDSSSARIWLDESSEALLHDGRATPAPLTLQESTVTLLPSVGGSPQDSWRDAVNADTEQPSDFSITLTKDESAFSGNYFIVFNSSDKQSGIDHYEVMEEPFRDFKLFKWGAGNAPWRVAQSPYVLKDQTLNSTILVKAIDKAGNERIARLVPDSAIRGLSPQVLIAIGMGVGVVVIIGAVVAYLFWRRKQRMHEEVKPE